MKCNKLLTLLIIPLVALQLACGGDDRPITEKSTVNVRMEAPATTLNPLMPSPGYSRYVAGQIFQSLATIDPKTLELKPLLIKEIPALRTVQDGPYKDQLAYDFEILDEAVWDDGSPITGRDVEFTLKLILHPLLPTGAYRSYFEYLTDIQIDPANPKKFTAYFRKYYMLALESMTQIPIYPAYQYDAAGAMKDISIASMIDTNQVKQLVASNAGFKTFADNFKLPKYSNDPAGIAGSGPYKLSIMDGDRGLTLVKKENWWGDALVDKNPLLGAYPEKLVYKVVLDEQALENMLLNEDVDVATNISPAKYTEWRNNATLKEKYDFVPQIGASYTRWLFNLQNPKLADVRVRRALAHLVDYDYLIREVQLGMAERIVGPVNPAKPFYAKNVPLYDYNVEKARQLLKDAGWSDTDGNGILDKMIDGKKTELTLQLMASQTKVAELTVGSIQQTARQAGVAIEFASLEINRITADTRAGNFETALLGAALHPGLVELYQYYHSGSLAPNGDNRARFINARADSLITAIRTTADETARNRLYVEAQQLLHDEVPEVYLYAPNMRCLAAKKFNYVLSPNRPNYYEHLFRIK